MTRRDIINTFAIAPVVPWVALKGVESPCKKKLKGLYIRIQMQDGSYKHFVFPDSPKSEYYICEQPTEKE